MLLAFVRGIALISPFLTNHACAGKAYNGSSDYDSGALGPSPTQSFHGSDFEPVQLNFQLVANDSSRDRLSDGYLFIAPRGTDVKQAGALILDQNGSIVWDGSEYGETMLFITTKFHGEDHILMWQGEFRAAGYGFGHYLLLDSAYNMVANFTTQGLSNNILADFHDAKIWEGDTATMTAYVISQRDISDYNGSSDGYIVSGVIQEIDLNTNEVIFTWDSIDHVDPHDCYTVPGASSDNPWDYFHINAVDKDGLGNYLVSSRHCHALFYIDHTSGAVIWRLGGKNSSFTMGANTNFSWQHDNRWRGDKKISLFDNAANDWQRDAEYARGMMLDVDTEAMTVELAKEWLPWNRTVSASQGNLQIMDNGNAIVGWGRQPFFQEYDSNGNALWAARFGVGDVQSYRAYRFKWTGRPRTPPSITVAGQSDNITVYASWNGATEVKQWRLLGSTTDAPQRPTFLSTVSKDDFETCITYTHGGYDYFQVVALDSRGETLAFSEFKNLDGDSVGEADIQTTMTGPLDDELSGLALFA
ncbi:ASST-domain-containing protein [Schizophyllum commune]